MKQVKKKEELSKAHQERLEILQNAKETKGKQLVLSSEEGEFGKLQEVDELKSLINQQIDDPEEKYNLYYNGIRKVLMRYLPKNDGVRRIIYDEKDIFLNRGKAKDKAGRRGGDGRMGYNEDMSKMVELISEWMMTSQDPIDLYQSIYDLNEKLGFGHQDYDETSRTVHQAMKKDAKGGN
jgi:hypothetical protein